MLRVKPSITTNIPFHCRIFDKGKCGLLIKSNDKKDFTEAKTTMYKNKDELKIWEKLVEALLKDIIPGKNQL
jgi:glycosyltransferase involved in cell wall biosynthesis